MIQKTPENWRHTPKHYGTRTLEPIKIEALKVACVLRLMTGGSLIGEVIDPWVLSELCRLAKIGLAAEKPKEDSIEDFIEDDNNDVGC